MTQHLSAITFFVDDYDSAIAYFTSVLNFTLTEDKVTGDDARFVLVTPPNSPASLLLTQAKQRRVVFRDPSRRSIWYGRYL